MSQLAYGLVICLLHAGPRTKPDVLAETEFTFERLLPVILGGL